MNFQRPVFSPSRKAADSRSRRNAASSISMPLCSLRLDVFDEDERDHLLAVGHLAKMTVGREDLAIELHLDLVRIAEKIQALGGSCPFGELADSRVRSEFVG